MISSLLWVGFGVKSRGFVRRNKRDRCKCDRALQQCAELHRSSNAATAEALSRHAVEYSTRYSCCKQVLARPPRARNRMMATMVRRLLGSLACMLSNAPGMLSTASAGKIGKHYCLYACR